MATPFFTAEDLAAFQNQVFANDPYTIVGKGAGAWNPNITTWSPTERGVSSLIQGFLGGFGSGAGQQRALNQTQTVMGMLPQLSANPMGVQAPEGVNPLAFQALQQTAAVNKQARDAAQAQAIQQSLLETSLAGLKKKSEVIGEQEGWLSAFAEEEKFRKALAEKQQKETIEKLIPTEGVKSLEETIPVNEKNPFNATLLKQKEKLLEQEKENFKRASALEESFYKRIVNTPIYSQYADISANFNTMLALKDENSIPASIGMISALARVWDPIGTVKEGEYKLNAEAQSALDSIAGNWRAVVNGEGPLNVKTKQAMINAAAQKYNTFGAKYNDVVKTQYDALKAQGGNPANIPTGLDYKPYAIHKAGEGPKPGTISPNQQQQDTSLQDVKAKVKAILAKKQSGIARTPEEEAFMQQMVGGS